jgi:hypothetical protein
MVTTAFLVRGHWLTGNSKIERSPRIRINSETTTAQTGRWIKVSVSFMGHL